MFDQFATDTAHNVATLIELLGIAIISLGAVGSLLLFARRSYDTTNRKGAVVQFRSDFGRAILLGLEFLIAADIINTVAVRPTLWSVAVLAGIVAIRTFLSFSLEVEIEGRWPWQKRSGHKRQD
jgi:uncharacterized membrane protein